MTVSSLYNVFVYWPGKYRECYTCKTYRDALRLYDHLMEWTTASVYIVGDHGRRVYVKPGAILAD